MLAWAGLGTPHSVIFGGFSAESLKDRTDTMQKKLIVKLMILGRWKPAKKINDNERGYVSQLKIINLTY